MMVMLHVPTLMVAISVNVILDSQEMERPASVNLLLLFKFIIFQMHLSVFCRYQRMQ